MKKTRIILVALALLGAACSSAAPATVDAGTGLRLIPETVDWRADVGRDASVAIDGEGKPSIVYLGFKQVLEEGDIPDARPLHFAPVPNVLQANIEGPEESEFWNIVSVSWQRVQFEFPAGDALLQETDDEGVAKDPTPNASANSTVDDEGVIHVTWTDSEGVKYANDGQGAFDPAPVAMAPEAFGASIAVGDGGQPWIAYYDSGDVYLSTPGVRGWITRSIGDAGSVTPEDGARTRVAIDGDGRPTVAYTDGSAPMVETFDAPLFMVDEADLGEEDRSIDFGVVDRGLVPGSTTSVVAPGGGGFGISLAVDAHGAIHVAYYDAEGGVHVAHGNESVVGQVAFDAPLDIAEGADKPDTMAWRGTGIAVDENDVGYLTWYDVASNSVKMSMNEGEKMTPVSVPSGSGGALPTITTSADGKAVWMAWYNSSSENLLAAHLTSAKEVTIAAVSPSPVVTAPAPPAPAPECEAPTLEVSAPVGASTTGFAETCLAADADKAFTLTFDNQDAGVPHNLAVYESDTATASIKATEIAPGPITEPLDMDPLKAGDYFYKCDVHPNMNGTLVIV